MLERLRRKFILVSVGSLLAVLLAFVVILNLAHYIAVTAAADQMLMAISRNQGELPQYAGRQPSQMPWDYPITEETPYETRYFVVRADENLTVTELEMDFISAVSGTDAGEYFQRALDSGKNFGYLGSYRFCMLDQEEGYVLIFLDCTNQLRSVRNVLLISGAGSVLILLGTGVLVFLFSKRAIQPMMKNVERQKRFITDASHEIRTPLTAIVAACDLLLMDDPDNEWLGAMKKEGLRMGHLVTELVALSRMDEEGHRPEKRLFSLSQAVWDIIPAFQATAQAQGKRLETQIQEDVWCQGDEGAIQRVVSILLDNAVKYSPRGSVIGLRLVRHRRGIALETSNPCPVLEREELELLFDRFYRSDPSRSRSTGGSGIGLSMAKAIVEGHGGQIRAWSTDGEDPAIHFQVRLRAAAGAGQEHLVQGA